MRFWVYFMPHNEIDLLRSVFSLATKATMSNTNDATHPEWRQLCQAALFETNTVKLLERITHARHAVLDRIEDGYSKAKDMANKTAASRHCPR